MLVVAFLWDMVSGGEGLRKKDLYMFTASEVSVLHVRKDVVEEGGSHVEVKKWRGKCIVIDSFLLSGQVLILQDGATLLRDVLPFLVITPGNSLTDTPEACSYDLPGDS